MMTQPETRAEETLLAWHATYPQVGLPILAVVGDLGATDQTRWSLLHARHAQLCRLKALRELGHDQEALALAERLDLEDQAEIWAQGYSL